MNLLSTPPDAGRRRRDWSPSHAAADESSELGTSPQLHDRLQHLTLRKKTSYR